MFYSTVLAACSTDSHGFKPQTSTNACRHVYKYEDQKDLAAILSSIQSAGVTPEVNLRNSVQARMCASEKSTLALKPRVDVTRVQNRGISGPTKRTYVLQKILKKEVLILSIKGSVN